MAEHNKRIFCVACLCTDPAATLSTIFFGPTASIQKYRPSSKQPEPLIALASAVQRHPIVTLLSVHIRTLFEPPFPAMLGPGCYAGYCTPFRN